MGRTVAVSMATSPSWVAKGRAGRRVNPAIPSDARGVLNLDHRRALVTNVRGCQLDDHNVGVK